MGFSIRSLVQYAPPDDDSFKIQAPPPPERAPGLEAITASLQHNIGALEARFHIPANKDLIVRRFILGKTDCVLVAIDGLTDRLAMGNMLMGAILQYDELQTCKPEEILGIIDYQVVELGEVERTKLIDDIEKTILSGRAALLVDGTPEALLIDVRGYEKRTIGTPKTEAVILGSQEAFTENLRTTITQIRRLVRCSDLVTEFIPVGSKAPLDCAVMYLAEVANPSVVEEVKRRIKSIDYDHLPGVGFIQQFIDDIPGSWVPQTAHTERPDRAASFLLEGQVVIACDGAPYVLGAPATIWHLLHTSDVQYMRWPIGFFTQFMRFVGLFLTLFVSGIYLALVTFHTGPIPTELLSAIVETHLQVPFTLATEIFGMLLVYDLMLEAGTRVPGTLGATIGIVGALILGEAAVLAKLVSPILIIIIAVTALGGFCIPDYQASISVRMARYLVVLAASFWGLVGVSLSALIIVGLLASLTSFGIPFLSPVSPSMGKMTDALFRTPLMRQNQRPSFLYPREGKRPGDKA